MYYLFILMLFMMCGQSLSNVNIQENPSYVDLIAPSSYMHDYEERLMNTIDVLEKIGIGASYKKTMIEVKNYSPVSHDIQVRYKHFIGAIENPYTKILHSIRGGYGSFELIPLIHRYFSSRNSIESTKILIGYSDITSLHLYFNLILNLPTVHATNGIAEADELICLYKQIIIDKSDIKLTIKPLNKVATKLQSYRSQIAGGNLTAITSSIGIIPDIKYPYFGGKILLIEDIGEYGYEIRRSFEHLRMSGAIDNVDVIILGGFTFQDKWPTRAHEEEFVKIMSAVNLSLQYIVDWCSMNEIAVFSNNSLGHSGVFMDSKSLEKREVKTAPIPIIFGANAHIVRNRGSHKCIIDNPWK